MAQSTYTQYYSNFVGADMSSDARVVARNRLAYSVNMWRDYESNQGAAVETFPGFRRIVNLHGEADIGIQGFWYYKGSNDEYILVHQIHSLIAYKVEDLVKETEQNAQGGSIFENMNQHDSTAFAINNRFYIINGTSGADTPQMVVVYEENGKITAKKVEDYYVPTTYYNGLPYEQRNGLGNMSYQINTDGGIEDSENSSYVNIPIYERVNYDSTGIKSVTVDGIKFAMIDASENFSANKYKVIKEHVAIDSNGRAAEIVLQFRKDDIYNRESKLNKEIKIKYEAYATHFNIVGDLKTFQSDKLTMSDAIFGCTKSAIYDGRIFLTGNPELPNTVFYSQRNLTGANDPTYFGVYNYFNDGDGNTPNVDLLATPSMLMVIKKDMVQDGSVYYHVGTNNTHSDESVRNLVPRIYPSTQGAAGLGSSGSTEAYSLSFNFLDDPVFLSRRGLEGVSKEQLNAERTIGHRSSNVDKLLVREDLAHASIAEWKGYLVICCNGHFYLADSRAVSQHQDGSYQYEWFYLENVGTYAEYTNKYFKVTTWPIINGVSLKDIVAQDQNNTYKIWDSEGEITEITDENGNRHLQTQTFGNFTINFYIDFADMSRYIVDVGQREGVGELCGARRVIAVGDLLFFATDYDICVFNTDMRGKPIKDESGEIIREVDDDKIDSSWYTFNSVPYKSACALRLDDCDKKSLTKTTIYGTTVARLKMMPGSRCKIKSSVNGRDWEDLGEVYSTRQDFADLRFDNISFTENEDNIAVLPEVSRGWIQKQYYFESDGFCEPFGLYELSYIYKIAGKIRYV